MSITFKAFTSLIAEGKRAYSSESYWKGDAEEAGYKIKKLSGDQMKGDQTWGAFNDQDEKVGEFTEKEDGRGGWLMEGGVNESFGIFRNNQKVEKDTNSKDRAGQAKKNGQGKGNDVDEDDEEVDDEEQDDRKKKTTSDTRSGSTRGTKSTQSTAAKQQAERDALKNVK